MFEAAVCADDFLPRDFDGYVDCMARADRDYHTCENASRLIDTIPRLRLSDEDLIRDLLGCRNCPVLLLDDIANNITEFTLGPQIIFGSVVTIDDIINVDQIAFASRIDQGWFDVQFRVTPIGFDGSIGTSTFAAAQAFEDFDAPAGAPLTAQLFGPGDPSHQPSITLLEAVVLAESHFNGDTSAWSAWVPIVQYPGAAADIAAPLAQRDAFDLAAFGARLAGGDPRADLAEPTGELDENDLDDFLIRFAEPPLSELVD